MTKTTSTASHPRAFISARLAGRVRQLGHDHRQDRQHRRGHVGFGRSRWSTGQSSSGRLLLFGTVGHLAVHHSMALRPAVSPIDLILSSRAENGYVPAASPEESAFRLLQALGQTPLNPACVVEHRIEMGKAAEDDRSESTLRSTVKFVRECVLSQAESEVAAAIGHFFEDDREARRLAERATP